MKIKRDENYVHGKIGRGIKESFLSVFTNPTEYAGERHGTVYNPVTKMYDVGNFLGQLGPR